MKILVTGGNGFIGSNFILHTLNRFPRFNIINIDARLEDSNSKNLQKIKRSKNYRFVKGNIKNKPLIEKLVCKCDAVINFAAESHVDRSISDPRPFVSTNIVGTSIILEAIRKYDKKLLQISTDEVFGSLKRGSATENSLLNPSSPYAASKAAAELLVNSYFTTYKSDVMITRCTNNYGPRQFPEKLIPKIILLALRNQSIPIYGTGKNIRDWIFVIDHCEAVLQVLLKGKSGQSYNISGKNELDNNTIVRKILKHLGKPTSLIKYVSDRPGHDFRYSLNCNKISKEIKWKPSFKFDDGIKYTIDWYVNNKNWWSRMNNNSLGKVDWKPK